MNLNGMKKELNFDELIKSDNLFSLCIAFFNLTDDNSDYFIIESAYKKSKFAKIELNQELLNENNLLISKISDFQFILKKNKHICYIKKTPLVNTSSIFYDELYKKIQRLREKYDDQKFSKIISASLFFPRGSIDITANLIAVDIYRKYQTKEYLNKMFYLLTSIGDLKQLNFNFREVQKQHIDKIQIRNTQIRINLKWFAVNLLSTLKEFNKYKFSIINDNLIDINKKTIRKEINSSFYDRLQFYIKNVLNLESNKLNITSLREKLNFNKNKKELIRNSNIIALAKILLPDFCSGCKDKYELKNRTFKYKNNDNWYLEVNHVISFANNNVDQFNNLCKLCPTCHRALTKNRAEESIQKEIIASILKYNPIVSDYISLFLENKNSMSDKIQYIYEKLK